MSETTTPDVVDGEVVKSTRSRAPKKPQDRQPKQAQEPTPAELADGSVPRDVEFHGHTYTVDLAVMDDRPIYRAMQVMQDDSVDDDAANIARVDALVKVFDALIGDAIDRFDREQRPIHGRIGAEVMSGFVQAALSGN